MKVPPKRKGNAVLEDILTDFLWCLNESPSEKEGKYDRLCGVRGELSASMKVPPKRKGNMGGEAERHRPRQCLNESPSEKEGKF